MNLLDRLLVKVRHHDGHWLIDSHLTRDGYARIWVDGKRRRAHRVAYELLVGPIPDGLQIDHLCKVRNCVNPEHLEPVTQAENLRRSEAWAGVNSRKTHCPRGHSYSHTDSTGRRICRECVAAAQRKHRSRNVVTAEVTSIST